MSALLLLCSLSVAATALAQDPTAGDADLRLSRRFDVQVGGGLAHAVAFSPNGTRLATGGERGDLIVWDRATRTAVWSRPASDHWIGAVAFSPDGRSLAAMGRDLTVWDAKTGEAVFRHAAGGPHGLAWSPDGTQLAYHSGKGIVNVLDAATWKIARCFQENERYPINSLAFTRDGRAVVAGDNNGRLWRLDLQPQTETVVRRHDPRRNGTNWCKFVGVLGSELVSAGWHGDVRIGSAGFDLPGSLYCGAVTPAGLRVAVAGGAGRVSIWSKSTGKVTDWELGVGITGLAFRPDGGELAATASDGQVRLYADGAVTHQWSVHPSEVDDLVFSADGTRLVVAGAQVVAVDVADGARRLLSKQPATVATGRSGAEVVLQEKARFVFVDAATGTEGPAFQEPSHGAPSDCFALSPDHRTLWVGAGIGSYARRFRVPGGESTKHGFGRYLDLAWSPDGKRVALGTVSGNHGEMGTLEVREASGAALHERDFRCGVRTVAFSPSGHQMVFAKGGGSLYAPQKATLHVLDANTFAEIEQREVVAFWLRFVDAERALSHDGSAITVWETATWRAVQRIPCPGIRDVVLSPDRRTLAVSDRTRVTVFAVER